MWDGSRYGGGDRRLENRKGEKDAGVNLIY